jgi:hypothetical protein
MANEINTISVGLDSVADDVIVFKNSDQGGAVTLIEAYAINHATTSGTASYKVTLRKRTAAGTVIAGTIAAAMGGTAASGYSSHWTDLSPKTFTLNSAHQTIDDGECVSVEWEAIDEGAPTRGKVVLHYMQGKAA